VSRSFKKSYLVEDNEQFRYLNSDKDLMNSKGHFTRNKRETVCSPILIENIVALHRLKASQNALEWTGHYTKYARGILKNHIKC
jgi:hypothetical protein